MKQFKLGLLFGAAAMTLLTTPLAYLGYATHGRLVFGGSSFLNAEHDSQMLSKGFDEMLVATAKQNDVQKIVTTKETVYPYLVSNGRITFVEQTW